MLRTTYRSFKSLLSQTGVTSTPETWKVNPEKEIWYRLYEMNKKCQNFQKKGCPYYDKLCNIYGDTTATGEHVHLSTRLPSDNKNVASCDSDPTKEKELNDDEGDSLTTRKRKRLSSPKRRVKKESIGSALTKIMIPTPLINSQQMHSYDQ